MFETTDALFTGICDAIREKDKTTALIRHQDIPARISAINGGKENRRYYIYKSGEEMNGHSITIYQKGTSSRKTEGWIYIHYYFMQTISSDLISAGGYKKVGLTFLADSTNNAYTPKFTVFSLRDTPDASISGNDYEQTGMAYIEQDILRYPDSKNHISGTVYFDIPDDLEEFYIVFQTVNVDFYIEEIWLE